jgi:hypothetical protein
LGTPFLNKFNIASLLFFLATRSHKMMQREGFFFFEFLMSILKGVQNGGVTVLRSGWNLAKLFVDL